MGSWEFEIVTIQQIKPPLPEYRGRWYQYTIANHITEITGTRRGSMDEVMAFVQTSLQRLNRRHTVCTFCKP